MIEVERFDPQIAGATAEGYLPMDQTVDGKWVRHSEYEKLLRALATCQKTCLGLVEAREQMREKLEKLPRYGDSTHQDAWMVDIDRVLQTVQVLEKAWILK